jgi:hypothetical protein
MMTPLTSLWLPILLSAVLVFIASSIIHMVLKYHASDRRALPDEESLRPVLRDVPPGDYAVPYAASMEEMKSPDYTRKLEEGPLAFITVRPAGSWNMGAALAQWFVFCLVVSVFAAYVASRAIPPGGDYLAVFRFAGATAFAGYGLALWQGPIWFGASVSATLKSTFDALIFALLTAGTLGWLWPA